MSAITKPVVLDGILKTADLTIQVGSLNWFAWLDGHSHFSYKDKNGNFNARKELRRNNPYWYAYRRCSGKLTKAYLGKTEELSVQQLEDICLSIAGKFVKDETQYNIEDRTFFETESRIDTSFLPIAKVNVPALPQILLNRPRLTEKITTPITLIYAPSGFGKSTLLNDWQQTCGFPVAWLSLDESDNTPLRFYNSFIMALQMMNEL